jgi:hypothetical protein
MRAVQRQDVGQRSAEGEGAPAATTFTSPGRGRAAGRSTVRGAALPRKCDRRFWGAAAAVHLADQVRVACATRRCSGRRLTSSPALLELGLGTGPLYDRPRGGRWGGQVTTWIALSPCFIFPYARIEVIGTDAPAVSAGVMMKILGAFYGHR